VRLRTFVSFALAAVGALLLSALASAQSVPPTYQGSGGEVQEDVAAGGADTLGGLPFTGLDLALIVGAGLLLVIAGVSIRRVAARRTTS
jgi:hypothetical protein